MSKHIAPTTIKTLALELAYHAQYGENTPDRNGKRRGEYVAPEAEAQDAA